MLITFCPFSLTFDNTYDYIYTPFASAFISAFEGSKTSFFCVNVRVSIEDYHTFALFLTYNTKEPKGNWKISTQGTFYDFLGF